jgi:hypothetical protein
VPEIWGRMYDVVSGVHTKGKNGMRNNRSPAQPRKVHKKLVSSNVAKILEKESSGKIRGISEKTMFTPSNLNKAT